MLRTAMKRLVEWKNKTNRKPLIIRGARQVGKTWLMKNFGEKYYERLVYINFDNNIPMKNLFDGSYEIERLITGLELYFGDKIEPHNTLIIFDEVQEVPNALSSLKYFNENAPEYHIICAGSLLGVALHKGTSFPVGKVEFLDLYPMSFFEFANAMGKEQFVDLLEKDDFEMATTFRQEYVDLLKLYYFVGGMPEAVLAFSERKDFNEVRAIQNRILEAYEQDFSKHAPTEIVPRIRMLWQSIPSQLAKENRKFIYGLVKQGARAKDYELALLWLVDCGLVHRVSRIDVPHYPLKAYEDLKSFKLFLLDVGLLSALVGMHQSILLEGDSMFKEFKGILTEQYVLQQLKTIERLSIYYWSAKQGTAELDFVIDDGINIVPIEVKAEQNLQAKSLKVYHQKFSPKLSVRASMSDYKKESWLLNIPLYAVERIEKQIEMITERS
ncbi:MAG: ATP-binding protein [Peptostreptococcaceae bacterium]|nr:ATP-binding protein [Peptostreptococcaceae bacterium]